MSPLAPPSLLAHDFEQLDRVARFLSDGRRGFFVLVCAAALRPTAIRYLTDKCGKPVPEPVLIGAPEAMMEALAAIDGKAADAMDSLAVEATRIEVWTALNWHREKLRRGGQVLLWLDSVEGLRALREHAADAYSFRENLVILEGQGAPEEEGWDEEESPKLKTARLLFELPRSPEERAEAALDLAAALSSRGCVKEAFRVASEGLALIPQDREGRHRDARMRTYQILADIAAIADRRIDAHRFRQLANDEIGDDLVEDWSRSRLRNELLCSSYSSLGPDRDTIERYLQSISDEMRSTAIATIRINVMTGMVQRGRFVAALAQNAQVLALTGLPASYEADFLVRRADIRRRMGRLDLASEDLTAVKSTFSRRSALQIHLNLIQAEILRDGGEVAAADTLLRHLSVGLEAEMAYLMTELEPQTVIQRHRGDVSGAIGTMARAIREALAELRDGRVYGDCTQLAVLLRQAHEADAASEQDLTQALTVIDSAGQTLIKAAGDDPPWYRVLFPCLRASVLSLFGSRDEEALATASEAVALARSLWKQALPPSTRVLVQCLARAGRWSVMDPAIAEALQAARAEDHLRELATVHAYALARLMVLQAPKETIETALSALQGTFSEMAAPRVEGETWLEVAPYLPPLAPYPDLLQVADRMHGLFLDMPMPEPAARCMEWLGDIHEARANRQRAESCYRMSLGTLDRYGLLLRRPLLLKKLAGKV